MRTFGGVIMAAVLAACGGTDETPRGVSVEGGFIRLPSEGRDIAIGGLTITTNGQDAKLIAARTPAADTVELHTHTMEDGIMRMRAIEAFELIDGDPFQIGVQSGPHFMLFDFDGAFVEGDIAPMTLTLEWRDGEVSTLTASLEIVTLSGEK